jgi:hypothetical protein
MIMKRAVKNTSSATWGKEAARMTAQARATPLQSPTDERFVRMDRRTADTLLANVKDVIRRNEALIAAYKRKRNRGAPEAMAIASYEMQNHSFKAFLDDLRKEFA